MSPSFNHPWMIVSARRSRLDREHAQGQPVELMHAHTGPLVLLIAEIVQPTFTKQMFYLATGSLNAGQ